MEPTGLTTPESVNFGSLKFASLANYTVIYTVSNLYFFKRRIMFLVRLGETYFLKFVCFGTHSSLKVLV